MRTVEVFADVRCPFTHVGLHRLVDWRERSGVEFVLQVRAWPLELVNRAPLGADLIAEEVELIRRSVAPELFDGLRTDRYPRSSIPAMSLVAGAQRLGAEAGERASIRVRDEMFERGVDIADTRELERIGRELGVERCLDFVPDVIDDWHEGQHREVIGSPHFFVGDDDFFCPSLHIERKDDGHLLIEPDLAGFEQLVDVISS
jgi:predicted DsbA family dithiol-disulfide isomerase